MTPPSNPPPPSADPPAAPAAGGEPPAPDLLPGSLAAVVLAAGQGTRMRSGRHKVLHPLAGKPLVLRVLDLVRQAGASSPVVVLGHQAEQVRAALPPEVRTILQAEQRGTGHAVLVAADALRESGASRLLVHYADVALVRPASLQRLLAQPLGPEAPLALLTARLPDPRGYGRVKRAADATVQALVEEAEATPAERSLDEIFSGVMLIWADWLWDQLPKLPRRGRGEYYLTDLVGIARSQGRAVSATLTEEPEEVHGVNSQAQLAEAHGILWRRKRNALMAAGVSLLDPATTFVEPEVLVEPDVVIHPGCHLRGETRIARGCTIGPDTDIVDSRVGPNSRVWRSVLEGAVVGSSVHVGPFSHLRPGAVIGDRVVLGNYAEVKGSHVGADTQVHHFSYLGDAEVGERVNVGAGTITANFDGRQKHRTTIGDDVKIGSDTVFRAPVQVGRGAVTGAGSVVTHDVADGDVVTGVPARPHRHPASSTERTHNE